ncbi:MAG: patatin-like phospholipase family protein [Pseudomonadota bacterium]
MTTRSDQTPQTGSEPPDPSLPFERVALVLQGGGALGSYQAGVYQALDEAGIYPDWVAGISIGAINSALICGNPPELRVERLREFWHEVTRSPVGIPNFALPLDDISHRMVNQMRAFNTLVFGQPGFFTPRFPSPLSAPATHIDQLSFYDITPIRNLLQRLVDFDYMNAAAPQMSVGAVNVQTGNFVYFDTKTHKIDVSHVLASGALPPGFPAVNVEGEYYWDGGLVSNTPLDWVLESHARQDTLTFQVDLWNARGRLPSNLMEADLRQKEIRFSSRTRLVTDSFRQRQKVRRSLWQLLQELPEDLAKSDLAQDLSDVADEKVYNIIQLIYRARDYEGTSKDFEFSRRTMEEHWSAGYNDTVRTLRHPEVLQRPTSQDGFFTFDVAREGRF